jgi:hypothetical protein
VRKKRSTQFGFVSKMSPPPTMMTAPKIKRNASQFVDWRQLVAGGEELNLTRIMTVIALFET